MGTSLINYFGADESTFVDPPSILFASIPLELSGETVRSRLCTFRDQEGDEYALRPDLTLPIALDEIEKRENGKKGTDTVHYSARAWRLPAESIYPLEFTQVGFEVFGAESSAEQDFIAFKKVCDAAHNAGVNQVAVEFGDLAVFPAFVDALGLKKNQAEKIKRIFRQARDVDEALKAVPSGVSAELKSKFKGMSKEKAKSVVNDIVKEIAADVLGSRSIEDITRRVIEMVDESGNDRPSGSAYDILNEVLWINVLPEQAADTLSEIAKASGLKKLQPMIDNVAKRFDAIVEAELPIIFESTFRTPFGRRFNYYDGFVFELIDIAARSTAPLGAGGRYDGLLSSLSNGAVNETAIGGVLRPDRVEEAC